MERNESVSADPVFRGFTEMAAVFLVTLIMVKLVMMMKKKRYNSPPGPWSLPLVGYLPFFGPQPHVTFNEMRKKYGDVISIRMGNWPAVVINGDAIKEALVAKRDDFAGRPPFTTARLMGYDLGLVYFKYDSMFKIHHRIVTNVLFKCGNARNNPVENIIKSNAKTVIEEFLSHGNESFCPLDSFDLAAFTIIYQLCCARYKDVKQDKGFLPFSMHRRVFEKFNRPGNIFNIIPWLRYLMPSKISKILELFRDGKEIVQNTLEQHESSFDEHNLRDITDGLIHAGNRLTEEEKALGVSKVQVVGESVVLLIAGFSTISSTLSWCVALMVSFPNVQKEVFQQIDRVVGQGRDITLDDRTKLPLVEAIICEVLRYVGIAPLGLPRFTTCDTTLQGYDIPEGTVVMPNLYSIFMDEKLWGDPKVFRPQRFLDSEGQLDRGLVEQVPAFSLGRRRCIGEHLARTELFLLFTTIMQRLEFFKPPGQPDLELKAFYSLTTELMPFDVCVRQRE